ncbi:translation initiation factor IF-1 [Candidatus Dojkabacteria bacterium]|nr:translation initiation factor IF-1 [Candidatus Dojkabacteria bacterium]
MKARGVVTDVLANTQFKVKIELDDKEWEVIAHLSGKMRMNYIRIQKNDEVDVMISPYDLKRGIIVYRH